MIYSTRITITRERVTDKRPLSSCAAKARDRKLEVLKTEMEKLREGEEDKELKILSLEDLCGVKEREVARYSDMLQEMQKRLHADHTAVLNEKTSVAKDLAAVKLALQESQIKIEREVQERRSIEHDLKMTRERMDKQKETQANELQKADKELAALTSAKDQIEAQRIEVVAEMGQVRYARRGRGISLDFWIFKKLRILHLVATFWYRLIQVPFTGA